MNLKKAISILVGVTMCLSMFSSNASAVESDLELSNDISSCILTDGETADSHLIIPQEFTVDTNTIRQINTNARGTWNLGNRDIFYLDETLSSDEDDDMYIWSLKHSASVAFKITSTDSNYVAAFYSLNMETGEATPLNFGDYASDNNANYKVNMPAGDYAIFVFSRSSTSGSDYSLMLNASNPANATHVMAESSNLAKVIFFYANNSTTSLVYSNGTCLTNNLSWDRRLVGNYGGGNYTARQCQVGLDGSDTSVYIKGISVGEYSSDYAGHISNAMFVELDEGTLFHVTRTVSVNPSIEIDHTDYKGLTTPRRLMNGIDISSSCAHYLVVDLNTGKVVDFASIANIFYSKGWTEKYVLPSNYIIYK